MPSDLSRPKLRARPLLVVSTEDAVIVKRGAVEMRIGGPGALAAVQTVLAATSGQGATQAAVEAHFAPSQLGMVRLLIRRLQNGDLLVSEFDDVLADSGPDEPAEVFFWQFGTSVQRVAERFQNRRLLIAGVNRISARLIESLRASGVGSAVLLDVPELRNPALFSHDGATQLRLPGGAEVEILPPDREALLDPEEIDCLIATADCGGIGKLSRWNEFCVLHERLFLPVFLEDSLGYVGPLLVPGETACLECFRARRLTHAPDASVHRAIHVARAAGEDVPGFIPPMASVLGDIACVEILKFIGIGGSLARVGTVIEMDLLSSRLTPRPVLRLPRCRICSQVAERPLTSGNAG